MNLLYTGESSLRNGIFLIDHQHFPAFVETDDCRPHTVLIEATFSKHNLRRHHHLLERVKKFESSTVIRTYNRTIILMTTARLHIWWDGDVSHTIMNPYVNSAGLEPCPTFTRCQVIPMKMRATFNPFNTSRRLPIYCLRTNRCHHSLAVGVAGDINSLTSPC